MVSERQREKRCAPRSFTYGLAWQDGPHEMGVREWDEEALVQKNFIGAVKLGF